MTPPMATQTRVSRLTIRLIWRWHHALGWKIEGPFPNATESRLLLLGPGLLEDSIWARFILMRIRFLGVFWHPQLSPDGRHHILACSDAHPLPDILDWAGQHGVQIQLVQIHRRHRRLRCNTPIRTERHPRRLRDYIERIFSHAVREANVTPPSTAR